ncbi:MAG: conjugative transposon protein TraM [Prevotella sp.]|nr:conjugative transposon protein TraM [Prevotella sp.]
MKEILSKINFKQPKYMLPAIIYFPLLFTGYFLIDTFQTKKAETVDPNMQSTEYLNPNLPQAKVKDDLDGKYESMLKSYGKIDDYSAISNIDREEQKADEEYESGYNDSEREVIDAGDEAQRKLLEMQEQLRLSAERGNAMDASDAPLALSDRERLIQSQQREQELQDELDRALAEIRRQQESPASQTGVSVNGTVSYNENSVTSPSEEDEPQEVVKRIRQSSDYFHTIQEVDAEPNLIKAIIDEDVKAVDGSRVRLRLLDDIEIGDYMMPKGSYIYAIMNGFGSQRVKGSVKSIMLDDEIIKVSLSIYDTDGLEGLYVPSSSFRETTKEVASGAMNGNMNINQGTAGNSLSQWGMQAVQNAYQRTTNAVSKSIRKNSAKLKYGTFVYLVNGKEKKND